MNFFKFFLLLVTVLGMFGVSLACENDDIQQLAVAQYEGFLASEKNMKIAEFARIIASNRENDAWCAANPIVSHPLTQLALAGACFASAVGLFYISSEIENKLEQAKEKSEEENVPSTNDTIKRFGIICGYCLSGGCALASIVFLSTALVSAGVQF